MKTTIIAIVTAIIFSFAGYILGGYYGVSRMARDSNYANLMWLTAIDKDLEQGNIDRAKKLTFQATDATFGALQTIDTIPQSGLMTVLGVFNMKAYNDQVSTRAKQHFITRLDELSEPPKIQIQQIVKVEMPQRSCPVKK